MSEGPQKTKLENIWIYSEILTEDAYTLGTAHFYRANFWGTVYLIMGATSILFSVTAGTSLLYGWQLGERLAGLLALISSIIIAVSTFLKPQKQEQDHSRAGSRFIALYYRVRVFCEVDIIRKSEDANKLPDELHELIKQRDEIDKTSPRIPQETWRKAVIASKAHFKKNSIVWK